MAKDTNKDYYQMSLAEIRKDRGLSQEQLGEITGTSRPTIYLIEAKKQIPKIDTAIAICKALGITLVEFSHSIGLDVSGLPNRDD